MHCANEINSWYLFKQQVIRAFEIGQLLMKNNVHSTDTHCATIDEGAEFDTVDCSTSVENKKINLRRTTRKRNLSKRYASTKTEEVVNQEKLTCNICQRKCPSTNALMKHQKVHRETKDYVCTKCGKAFKQSQTLADHMKRHYDLKKFACDICGKRFYKQYNVNMHVRVHTGEKPYQCTYCDKSFTRPLLLRNHIKQVQKKLCLSLAGH